MRYMSKRKKLKVSQKEHERRLRTERALQIQDSDMWEHDEGISQLEGRIETENWQG